MRFHESFADFLRSETKLKVARFLLNHEASMSEREIASILKISHMSVNRMMAELAEMNLVSYGTVGKAHLWKVNRNSFAYKALTQLFDSLKNIPDALMELTQLILKHLPRPLVQKAVLFGSIAKNKEKPDSDIDLFILVKTIQDQEKLEAPLEKLSGECLDVFGNRLAPYVLTEKQLKGKQNLSIISEINKGIPIYPQGRRSLGAKI